MKCYLSVVCVLSALIAVNLAAPAVQENSENLPLDAQADKDIQVVKSEETDVGKLRERRDISLLRRLCPQLFQVIDNVIQNVTSQVFRIVGGAVLRSGGLGGGGGARSGDSGSRVSVVLPTFPPDDDDDEEETSEESTGDVESRIGGETSESTTAASSLPLNVPSVETSSSTPSSSGLFTSNPSDTENEVQDQTTTSSPSPLSTTESTLTTTTISSSDIQSRSSETDLPGDGLTSTTTNPMTTASDDGNTVKREIRRRVRAAEDDQQVAASGGNGPNPADDLSNVETDDGDRNKRYLPFGGDGGHGGGPGSGNFLFDLIRNTADRAARTVGTVYRMVAGTENLGFGVTATSTSTKTLASSATNPQLVAGSGATEESDEKEGDIGGVAEVDVAPKHGDGEGIPGPITRLLVIANRGIANLIQDLILRLAQTSERIVNFKARLVTALI